MAKNVHKPRYNPGFCPSNFQQLKYLCSSSKLRNEQPETEQHFPTGRPLLRLTPTPSVSISLFTCAVISASRFFIASVNGIEPNEAAKATPPSSCLPFRLAFVFLCVFVLLPARERFGRRTVLAGCCLAVCCGCLVVCLALLSSRRGVCFSRGCIFLMQVCHCVCDPVNSSHKLNHFRPLQHYQMLQLPEDLSMRCSCTLSR